MFNFQFRTIFLFYFHLIYSQIIFSNDIFTGELRNINIIGIIDKKLIVSFLGSSRPIAYYYRNLKLLKSSDNQNDSEKFNKYGFRGIRYNEYIVPNSEEIVLISSNEFYEKFNKDKKDLIRFINQKNKNENSNLIAFKIKNNGSISTIGLEAFLNELERKLDL
jgi:hypothetical protein